MFRIFLFGVLIAFPTVAQAQPNTMPGMPHNAHSGLVSSGGPTEPGQAAFAAIQEIVALLVANPATDWSMVDIEALRQHLVDMDNVTLRSNVTATAMDDGMQYVVKGMGAVRESIIRMVLVHAKTASGNYGLMINAAERPDGAVMTITVTNQGDLSRLKALGFMGVMALGMHHQEHHLGIATRHTPH